MLAGMGRMGEWAQGRWDARIAAETGAPTEDDPAIDILGSIVKLSEQMPRTDAKREELLTALDALGADRHVVKLVEELEAAVLIQGMLMGKRIWT